MKYQISFSKSAFKELENLNEKLVSRIFPKIEALTDNPHPIGCKKLQGKKELWRIRIGDYRVLYSVSEHQGLVDIIAVRHRKDAYLF